MWYLIVSIPDLCTLTYFQLKKVNSADTDAPFLDLDMVSTVSLSLSHWYPGSGVVLDCIDS